MAEFKGKTVTRSQVLEQLAKYDTDFPNTNDYENWLDDGTYVYALKYDGKLYPPKYILSRASGLPLSDFSGGDNTNDLFEELGFAVRDKRNHVKYWKIAPGEEARFWSRCVKDRNIAVGWDDLEDMLPFLGSYSEFLEHYIAVYPDGAPKHQSKQVNQLWAFLTLPAGDVIIANKGISRLVGRGRVVGSYQYVSDYEEYSHIIPVDWFDITERPVPTNAKEIAAPWFAFTIRELTKEQYSALYAEPPETGETTILRKKKQIILYGPPGTGKTYATRRLAVSLAEDFAQLKESIH